MSVKASKVLGVAAAVAAAALVLVGCSAGEEPPSAGTYTIQFPSTAAAVATYTVQLLLFDLPADPGARPAFCQSLIDARKRRDLPKPTFQNQPVNICEMSLGRRPVTVPYGEQAVLAIAQRRESDFMIGCAIQTFGQGDAPVPIAMALVDPANPVPDTKCASVSDFCTVKCTTQ